MARRTELKGIVNSLNGTFVSRNNDFDGYWSIGRLKRFAIERRITSVEFSFLNHKPNAGFALINYITRYYTCKLAELLAKQQIPDHWVRNVSITINFSTISEDIQLYNCPAPGDTYKCICQIMDDNGRTYSSIIYGRCLPHSTARELRSSRKLPL